MVSDDDLICEGSMVWRSLYWYLYPSSPLKNVMEVRIAGNVEVDRSSFLYSDDMSVEAHILIGIYSHVQCNIFVQSVITCPEKRLITQMAMSLYAFIICCFYWWILCLPIRIVLCNVLVGTHFSIWNREIVVCRGYLEIGIYVSWS